jgi:uncharacterized protein with GYD domain
MRSKYPTEGRRNEIMHAIVLAKLRGKMTKELIERVDKVMKDQPMGVKINSMYYTLGRYDFIIIAEVPDEKAAMAALLQFGDAVASETLIAVPREEAHKLLK